MPATGIRFARIEKAEVCRAAPCCSNHLSRPRQRRYSSRALRAVPHRSRPCGLKFCRTHDIVVRASATSGGTAARGRFWRGRSSPSTLPPPPGPPSSDPPEALGLFGHPAACPGPRFRSGAPNRSRWSGFWPSKNLKRIFRNRCLLESSASFSEPRRPFHPARRSLLDFQPSSQNRPVRSPGLPDRHPRGLPVPPFVRAFRGLPEGDLARRTRKACREQADPGEGMPGEGRPGEGVPGEGFGRRRAGRRDRRRHAGEGIPGEGMPGEGIPGLREIPDPGVARHGSACRTKLRQAEQHPRTEGPWKFTWYNPSQAAPDLSPRVPRAHAMRRSYSVWHTCGRKVRHRSCRVHIRTGGDFPLPKPEFRTGMPSLFAPSARRGCVRLPDPSSGLAYRGSGTRPARLPSTREGLRQRRAVAGSPCGLATLIPSCIGPSAGGKSKRAPAVPVSAIQLCVLVTRRNLSR